MIWCKFIGFLWIWFKRRSDSILGDRLFAGEERIVWWAASKNGEIATICQNSCTGGRSEHLCSSHTRSQKFWKVFMKFLKFLRSIVRFHWRYGAFLFENVRMFLVCWRNVGKSAHVRTVPSVCKKRKIQNYFSSNSRHTICLSLFEQNLHFSHSSFPGVTLAAQ